MAFQISTRRDRVPVRGHHPVQGLEDMGELLTEPRALARVIEQLALHTGALQRLCRGMHIDFTA